MTYVQTVRVPVGSIEFVTLVVEADADLTMGVELSLTPKGGAHDWKPAGWVGAVGKKREARSNVPITHATGTFVVHARLTDSPETPIIASQNAVEVK